MDKKPISKEVFKETDFERAIYYADLDRLEYMTKDCEPIICEINDYFAVLRDKDEPTEIVGFTVQFPEDILDRLYEAKQKEKKNASTKAGDGTETS